MFELADLSAAATVFVRRSTAKIRSPVLRSPPSYRSCRALELVAQGEGTEDFQECESEDDGMDEHCPLLVSRSLNDPRSFSPLSLVTCKGEVARCLSKAFGPCKSNPIAFAVIVWSLSLSFIAVHQAFIGSAVNGHNDKRAMIQTCLTRPALRCSRAPYDILFCGTDTFASRSLSALLTHRSSLCSSLHVLTPPDVHQSWGATRMKTSPVKQLALQHSLPHQDVPTTGMVDYTAPPHLLSNPKAILLTCSFGHLIPDTLLDAFPNPWQRINIHPSLLPHLRGAAPIQWALARRLSTSGVSIQTLEKGRFDTGTIVAQQEFDFPPVPSSGEPSFLEVEKVMADRAASLLVRTLSDLPQCWRYSWEQDERMKSYAPKLKVEHSVVRWDRWSARDIVAREGAFAYLYPLSTNLVPPANASFRPVAITLSNTSAVPLDELRKVDPMLASVLKQNAVPPGSAIFSVDADMLIVKTTSDAEVLGVRNVKVAGKKGKEAKDWWRAYRDRADARSGLLLFQ
ncbi:hypothetical protein PHSY_006032 [Pseudozyma hubeiensis SY62]|uniref:methionyl-tRNA formyltransferase n=1 Tax=Pseudozyma hubeiensis (strain SY62) TaxID=1305764 RepID=R9PAL8_PSEHS|nr:hypothetical protein PHSY_006032 [Pseudozyma hubeiensis SY62]GAC98438.1 hypothetical protein PHSY_006032 [Pseudozyma hubeiensis SY62]